MSTDFSGNESLSVDEIEAIIADITERQNQRFPVSSSWRSFGFFAIPAELPYEDPSGLEGSIIAPASFVDSPPVDALPETDVQALRKDWVAVGNDLRVAMLRHLINASG